MVFLGLRTTRSSEGNRLRLDLGGPILPLLACHQTRRLFCTNTFLVYVGSYRKERSTYSCTVASARVRERKKDYSCEQCARSRQSKLGRTRMIMLNEPAGVVVLVAATITRSDRDRIRNGTCIDQNAVKRKLGIALFQFW